MPRTSIPRPARGDVAPSRCARPALAALGHVEASQIDRWFAGAGAPPSADLARSGAPGRTLREILALGTIAEQAAYFEMSLDYGAAEGTFALREALASSGCVRRADELVVTNGAVEALLLTCAAVAPDGGRIAVATPAYEGIWRCAEACGAELVAIPVWREGAVALDLAGFDEVLGSCAAIVVNRPHNPTGLTFTGEALRDLARRCTAADTVLIVDEVALATLDPTARSFAFEAEFADGSVITVGDVSKSLGLGGLRIGWLSSASARVLARVRELKDLTSLGSSAPSQALATLAVAHRRALSPADLGQRNLAALTGLVAAFGGSMPLPADGLVAFPALSLPLPSLAFAELARGADLAVLPGALFGCEGRLRIGLGVAGEVFDAALERLAQLLGRLGR